jgi:hypothetical protein
VVNAQFESTAERTGLRKGAKKVEMKSRNREGGIGGVKLCADTLDRREGLQTVWSRDEHVEK